jgi:transketolase
MSLEYQAERIARLQEKAKDIRLLMLDMIQKAGGGHYGGSLSVVEILITLYFDILKIDPKQPDWPRRDRFILSKGHAAAAWVPVLAEVGFFEKELIYTFNKFGSSFGMHTDRLLIPGCEMSCGSLGHGLSVAGGMALAAKHKGEKYRVFTLIGDGENMEGTIWEAAMVSAHYKLDNLVCIVDRNYLIMDGFTEDVMAIEPLADKWRAFGWACQTIDGHSIPALLNALESIPWEKGRPNVLIASTIKGKGIPLMEHDLLWHYGKLSDTQYKQAIAAINSTGGNR